jgi:hypothetical protein
MYDYSGLRQFLIDACDCKIYKPLARPYQLEEDVPDFYKCPNGIFFIVPEPDREDGKYSDYLFNKIMSENNLSAKPVSVKKSKNL